MAKGKSDKPTTLPDKFQAGFLSSLDKRSELARGLKTNYEAIVRDIAGDEGVSHVKASLVERFVWLEALLQTIEQQMANGEITLVEGMGRWIQGINALTGLAKTLGIERRITSQFYL